MMKKVFLYGSVVIIVAIIILGISSPKSATVQRSIVVGKSIDTVFPYFLSLQNMEEYSPRQTKDSTTVHKYTGDGSSIGSVHRWTSEHKQVGVGEQEIKSIKINDEITSELRLEEPFGYTHQRCFKFKSINNSVMVTWEYNREFGFVESMIMRFVDMDKVLGADFEKGLNTAKGILEK